MNHFDYETMKPLQAIACFLKAKVLLCYYENTRIFQLCNYGNTRVFQLCNYGNTRVFQLCNYGNTRVFWSCYFENMRILKAIVGFFKIVSD